MSNNEGNIKKPDGEEERRGLNESSRQAEGSAPSAAEDDSRTDIANAPQPKKSWPRRIAGIMLKCIAGLLIFLVVVIGLLYIPAVQDFVVPKVLNMINSGSDMQISVGRFRLTFPLDVDFEQLEIFQYGDTMLMADRGNASLQFMPLLKGNLSVDGVNLDDVYYKSGTPDSVTYIRARANTGVVDNVVMGLSSGNINASTIDLADGFVKIALKTDTLPPTPPSDTKMLIAANKLELHNMMFQLTMDTSVDSINGIIPRLSLRQPKIDMGNRRITARSADIAGLNGTIVIAAETVEVPIDTTWTPPWGISLDQINLSNGSLIYKIAGAEPLPGLDFNYMQFSDLGLRVDSFDMLGTSLHIPIANLAAHERCGLDLNLKGVLDIDSLALKLNDATVSTPRSGLQLNASYGMLAGVEYEPLSLDLTGKLSPADFAYILPSMDEIADAMPRGCDINLNVVIDGNLNDLNITRADASMDDYWDISLAGDIRDYNDLNRAEGKLSLSGSIIDIDFLKPAMLDPDMQKEINIPRLTLDGNVNLSGGVITGDLKAVTSGGRMALDARWDNLRDGYKLKLNSTQFPVNAFLPGFGVGRVTASADIDGLGLDPFSKSTRIKGNINLAEAEYQGNKIKNISLKALLNNGMADVALASDNRVLDLDLNASGNLAGKTFDWKFDGDIRNVDLHSLQLTDSIADIEMKFAGSAVLTPSKNAIDATLSIPDFDITYGGDRIKGTLLDIDFAANDSLTAGTISNHDLNVDFTSPMVLDSIMAHFDATMAALDTQLAARSVNIEEIHHSLPQFNLQVNAGNDNVISDYLAASGTTFKKLNLKFANDSIITFDAVADTIAMGDTNIDHIDINAYQRDRYLRYRAVMTNAPGGSMDELAYVQANGYIAENQISVFVTQKNAEGKTGYNLGAMATLDTTDGDVLTLRFVPYKPTIAYKPWTVNRDNYLRVNLSKKQIEGDLTLGNNVSSIRLHTSLDSVAGSDRPTNRILLDISDVKIEDWIALNPYSPPIKGDVSANLNVGLQGDGINGNGKVTIADLMYNKKRVGTFDLDVNIDTNRSGTIYASASIDIDGRKAITASGNVNDSTAVSPFKLDLTLTRFPLSIANPFIADMGSLSGYLNGDMDVTGSLASPEFNGYMAFDSAAVNVAMIGSKLSFDDERIPVEKGIVKFKDYDIFGANKNPLEINGTVDLTNLANAAVDLNLDANNMQIISAEKSRKSDVYGKAFISLGATVKGNMTLMNIDANLAVNEATNVTYILPDATAALTSRSNSDMVKFINFADTTAVALADTIEPPSGMMNINAILNIKQGAIIGVDLSATDQNRVQLLPSGILDYSLNPLGNSRLTGRLNIEGGYVRYTPPLMSEKLFNFQPGSYVNFSGDMMDPRLHLMMIDKLQANVTQEGQNSRLIYFDVALNVDGTLEQMDVKFDLSTDDDVTVQNELLSMSPEQRANQAINMLLYNTYTGPNTKGNSNLGGNALYSFLESTVNSWMANNIKGVDITLGIDQYQRTVDGSSSNTTSYSYKVSKSLWGDRVKIVVGGNYSTDASADENVSDNLVNDISVEYYINKSGTMYVRLFRHTGYESILEGEVTQTGVGFVYKRKMRKFRYLFNFLKPKKRRPSATETAVEGGPVPVITNDVSVPLDESPDGSRSISVSPIIVPEKSSDED